jgi:ureidoglycolate lyase
MTNPDLASTASFVLRAQPLTAAAFAPFGQVVEALANAPHQIINDGFALRFNSGAVIDTARDGGRPLLSIFRAKARQFADRVGGARNADRTSSENSKNGTINTLGLLTPLSVVERHLLGSQLFIPLSPQAFVVVVARAGPPPAAASLAAFVVSAGQGVNLAPGTWHHPLLALQDADFLVIERQNPDDQDDCEVLPLTQPKVWLQL